MRGVTVTAAAESSRAPVEARIAERVRALRAGVGGAHVAGRASAMQLVHEAVTDAESVSMAMLVVLETLSPLERAVFVLKDVFGFSHAEILFSGGLKVTVMADVETVLRELATALSRA